MGGRICLACHSLYEYTWCSTSVSVRVIILYTSRCLYPLRHSSRYDSSHRPANLSDDLVLPTTSASLQFPGVQTTAYPDGHASSGSQSRSCVS